MQWLRQATRLLLAGELEPEEAPAVEAGRELIPGTAGPEGAEEAAQEPRPEAGVRTVAWRPSVTEEDLRRAADAGRAAAVKLAGARALPWVSTVSRRGERAVFVVTRGLLAAGRHQAVYYAAWPRVKHAVCTAAGNIDSGAVFHGFRTTDEAAAYWAAAVGDHPWPLAPPEVGEARRT